ncbi:xylan 1,4-beta-xylosidase [Enterococcus sp. AZ194]|uniref:family 43 glycosylhydrolase n=1 Tax=Enterococcus sp. AZ194 TaxID=2774629 RepID=UPI003F1FEEDF
MTMIKNPIIPGMAPDPSIIHVEGTYYIATSTFHWNPGIQIYQSTDFVNWTLLDFALKKGEVNLRGTNTPAGIWAPHLSYDEKTKKYWLAYSHMVNMAGREFNSDSYAMWSYDICGPWSEPIYLTSIGFDPALFHDEDGKHYIAILEWETRQGYQAPGHIVLAEFDLDKGQLVGEWHRVTQGFTTRGCAEAPQLYKKDEYYYLLLAAGGTGYAHGVEIGRSKSVFGPYEAHPSGEPIITSSDQHLFSLGDPDAGHFEMYNPNSRMQKAGHGSLVQTHTGEWYIAHLMSRPLEGTLLNPLGRETSLQKMFWTTDGWLEMADGTNLAKMEVEGLTGVSTKKNDSPIFKDDFSKEIYSNKFMTPYREQKADWVNTTEHPGSLTIHGQNSFFSQVNPAILATPANSFHYLFETSLKFQPIHYSQTAGAGFYYDSNNWLYAHLTYSETVKKPILTILQAKLGERIEFPHHLLVVPEGAVFIKAIYNFGQVTFYYRLTKETEWLELSPAIEASYLSDEGVNGEPGEIGGFTGLFNFVGSVDSYQRQSTATFDYYLTENL